MNRRGCKKKIRYRSEAAARGAVKHRRRFQPDIELRVYDCPICQGWHLTKQPRIQTTNKRGEVVA